MESNKVEFKIPKIEELDYRRKLLADKETMSYNIGYGEADETGCIEFKENHWEDWFSRWINNIPEKYYAYIISSDENIPVGEVALRYVSEKNSYCINIIIEAQHRGKGFSEQALRLLIKVAFNELGADKVFDDFPSSRITAEKVFKKVGFKRVSNDIVELTKQDYLSKGQDII
ncbi:GNAT family N-acetyltransferase [Clostridium senegalense]|uniref:GNAT family N-acetyltransferase n=1 Tax=Clostridium senegalense TaxID=1465809 RepID=A0A6M0H292_9CLOT|nr:GNAT family N-acetyltransferase [Clostridium senegalense]NEU04845.1 GNAT family N-acetyltransferase [Clostridium senegalense]